MGGAIILTMDGEIIKITDGEITRMVIMDGDLLLSW
jgi:hypothetical protein